MFVILSSDKTGNKFIVRADAIETVVPVTSKVREDNEGKLGENANSILTFSGGGLMGSDQIAVRETVAQLAGVLGAHEPRPA